MRLAWHSAVPMFAPRSEACEVPAPQTDEAALAVELWWRGSALEALGAFVLGPLAQAGRLESVRLQKTIGSLLQPTLDAISSAPAILVRPYSWPG